MLADFPTWESFKNNPRVVSFCCCLFIVQSRVSQPDHDLCWFCSWNLTGTMRRLWLVRNLVPSHPGGGPAVSQRRPVAREPTSVTAVQGDRGRVGNGLWDGFHWGDVSERRTRQGKNNTDHTSHRHRPHFYCIGSTLDSNMLVQSVAGYKLAGPLRLLPQPQAFPSPPWTLFLLIPLTAPSAEAVIRKHFGCKQWVAYNTRMGWVQCPLWTWNPQKWLERQDASLVANRMMAFKTHKWFLFSFWIPGVYWN